MTILIPLLHLWIIVLVFWRFLPAGIRCHGASNLLYAHLYMSPVIHPYLFPHSAVFDCLSLSILTPRLLFVCPARPSRLNVLNPQNHL